MNNSSVSVKDKVAVNKVAGNRGAVSKVEDKAGSSVKTKTAGGDSRRSSCLCRRLRLPFGNSAIRPTSVCIKHEFKGRNLVRKILGKPSSKTFDKKFRYEVIAEVKAV